MRADLFRKKGALTGKRPRSQREPEAGGDGNPRASKQAKSVTPSGEDTRRNRKFIEGELDSDPHEDVTMEESEEDHEGEEEEEEEDIIDEDDEELGDPLCILCDDGGDLLW